MDEVQAYREIISRILSVPDTDEATVRSAKIEVCRKYGLPVVPKNSAILAAALPEERETLRRILMVKPSRTLSGVAPVAVMTSPYPCPHGKCLPCPGGPDHPFHSPQSYTGEEPAAKRAREHDFDPFRQVQARLTQFETLGHRVEKVELIVMGGTMTARPVEYQQEFVARCIEAMNTYPGGSPAAVAPDIRTVEDANELSGVRCVAITFETRPDWSKREHIDRMLEYGVTKVELGVQHVDDAILTYNRRGCMVADTVEANTLLRDAGLKVGFHMMPNLPGSDMDADRRVFETLFNDPRFWPDFLKIYPTLVTPGSEIEALWQEGKYSPYAEDDLVDLIVYGKSLIPEYTRLQRIQRDIPAKLNRGRLEALQFPPAGPEPAEEVRETLPVHPLPGDWQGPSLAESEIQVLAYDCCGGTEDFISAVSGDSLIGFARLRFPSLVYRQELEHAALLRELHVYGSLVPVGKDAESEEWQHREYGKVLLARAEEIARSAGFGRLAIMSGIGVRPYYRRQGYERRGPYMIRELS